MNWDEYDFETRAIRAGQIRSPENEHSEALFLTSSFVFNDAAEAHARMVEQQPGNVYSRFTNSTVNMFEQRLASMEGGERCIGTSSGMAAIFSTCMGLLKTGDHVVTSRDIFGASVVLFNKLLPKFGVETSFAPLTDLDAWAAAIRPNTRLLFLETPSNPLTEIADIEAMAKLAHDNDCLLVVDNCFCTPALQQPLSLGADLVIHSATKYLDGQGRCVGGAIVGPAELLDGEIYGIMRTAGPSMSPFNAWVFLKGLETLKLRMQASSDSALSLAQWLVEQPGVKHVNHPGLCSHPHHLLAKKQQSHFGGIVSFEVEGGRAEAWRLVDAVEILSRTANLGDTKSTITHPATTTHGRLSDEQRAEAGVTEGLIRVSVGLESLEDLQRDLSRGLATM
ncbi:MAG: O-succinylhomoserine sulfhydrylase [Pseudomonadota bacterium]